MNNKHIIIIRNANSFDFGGGERVPVLISKEVSKNSSLKTIILSRNKKLLEFAESQSVNSKRSWWWSRQNWSGARALLIPFYLIWQIILYFYYIIIFINLRASVVHIQSKDDFIAATFAAKTVRARVLWSDYADLKHIFLNHNKWYKNPVGKMVYFAAHFTEKIIVVSNEDKSLISAHIPNGKVKDKFQVIYNGAFDSYTKTSKNKKFTFISTGRLVTDKGIGELIAAFNKFSKKHPETELHILSDGPERSKFIELAKPNKSIIFYGHQSNPFEFINRSHVFILPTYHEGFSVALVEACMLNMPIIATNVGGNPEIIIDHKTGILIPVKDSDSLFMAMEMLYSDEKLCNKLGDNARKQYLEKFQFDQIVKNEFIPLYRVKK